MELTSGFATYHSHSRWSDGYADLEDMVGAAEAAGLDEYGLSDHFVVAPWGTAIDWSMPLDQVDKYVAEVERMRTEAQIPVRLGIEIDFFPETVDEVVERLSGFPFDYWIGSVHFADRFPLDSSADDWAPLSEAQVDEKHRLYWQRVRQLAESRRFDFIGHLDLPKKYGFLPRQPLTEEIDAALAAIAAADLAVELNTAGWDKPCADCYPSAALLRRCREAGVAVLINDDSHAPHKVGRNFFEAAALLYDLGFREMARFAGRQRTMVRLPVFV